MTINRLVQGRGVNGRATRRSSAQRRRWSINLKCGVLWYICGV